MPPSSLKLLTAFITLLNEKPLAKITTLDLIRTANISRSTFYRHFSDKLDFYEWVKSYLLSLFLKDDYSQDTPIGYYTGFFQHFADYRPAFKSFILKGAWQDFETQILVSGINNYSRFLDKALKQPAPTKLIASYIVTAHLGVALNWLRTDDVHSPAQMATVVTKLTDSVLANYDLSLAELMAQ